MWIEIAHFATIAAFFTAMVQIIAPLLGVWKEQPAWIRTGRQAAFTVASLLVIASAGLIMSFMKHDFSVEYVASHASLKLPLFYLATAMWGGHEGSLLLWSTLLALFTAVAAWRHWTSHPVSMPWVLAILGALITGFLLLVLFLSSPFERLIPPPPDGRDLNPLLQDPGMVFHPPFLYMGYVGFAIPYAFAMAALITGRAGEEWILATRRWTLFSWAMLTTGIVFGAYWAYYELGWGGFWAWDPVENASFMPWLTGTAFLHSVMVQERRQMFKIWNLFLIIATFALSLLGTFLVRSGVLSSVHAFANDPGRGVYILMFMTVVLIFSFGMLTTRSDRLATPARMESLVCRENAFLFNNLFFVVATVTVLLGTLYPLAVETLSEAKVSVGAPYYNQVFIPIMLGMLVLMGVGPQIAWRRASRLGQTFRVPAVVGVVGVGVALALGVQHPYGVISSGLLAFILAGHVLDIVNNVQARRQREGMGVMAALLRLFRRNKRRYGGFVVHLGVLVMVAGFIGSGLFQEERHLVMKVGDTAQVGEWKLTLDKVHEVSKRNWTALEAVVTARRGDLEIQLSPQKRVYERNPQPTTEASIYTTWREDIYLVFGESVGEAWSIRAYRNPLVAWIWNGSMIIALGVVFAMMEGRVSTGRRR